MLERISLLWVLVISFFCCVLKTAELQSLFDVALYEMYDESTCLDSPLAICLSRVTLRPSVQASYHSLSQYVGHVRIDVRSRAARSILAAPKCF